MKQRIRDYIGANGEQGSAYVFVKPDEGWSGALTESAKVTASDGAAADEFGFSVAIHGEALVVGASRSDIGANLNQGSAYVFVKSDEGWSGALTESAKITASDGLTDDQFGVRVAISGGAVVVGVPFDDVGTNANQGSAYVFESDPRLTR